MKIMTVLGTRPEIIRLSLIIKKLDQFADQHILVHTGQNFTATLNDVFFDELDVRKPDYVLGTNQLTLGEQLSLLFKDLEKIISKEKPDKVLVLGDTNSGLSAILSERMGIPVVHMEAGNRCFDLEVPEEKNRKIIDAVSSCNLPYTPNSKENLLREGIQPNRVFLSGNPIYEVLEHNRSKIEQSTILDRLQLKEDGYFLATFHRAENVDHAGKLAEILKGLNMVADIFQKKIICSVHPRTQSRIEASSGLPEHPLVEFHEPFGFFDFVKLEKNCLCALTDSGTVQEECCLFHIPTVTIRKTTERPETIECGSNMLSGIDAQQIALSTRVMIKQPRDWTFPEGYDHRNVSDKVIKIVMGGMNYV
ncbi:UDP-N-acetylglucosamine 2-epimerase (non-hydrolyzing) [Gracilibacillus caseinilyticus]|uniref:UDP-N-acetylglucosamine 2-epimerase (Non-hydrolyzing) n=1 Tax=Gracilibacillus caseinilyticus TaxID=2932256 RepID=A0ABY4EW35_9BACI|nr:UDP-N-acetylglucosamine 2-epimerase (non-hydrolyzing) [Gracilibacillus caseinilyticus]UOQ48609.1 UDP-N-acetylglucosamine 2-epimerase (non-hydrolyzing) [Gracilibacillus caseinilyticus]